MKVIGIYIIDGLAPSPQLTLKMQLQLVQQIHDNNFIAHSQINRIGLPAIAKVPPLHFFRCHDLSSVPPPKEKCPNVKVGALFWWCRYSIWKEARELAENFSIGEQTCKIQGKSEYKTHCRKFKRVGDGIQRDCIADDGFTYDFYFRNEPVDMRWIDKKVCVQYMLDCFKCLET